MLIGFSNSGELIVADDLPSGSFGGQTLSLRRGSCTLHGAGAIGLGGPPSETQAPTVRFEVLHLAEAASPMLMRRGGL